MSPNGSFQFLVAGIMFASLTSSASAREHGGPQSDRPTAAERLAMACEGEIRNVNNAYNQPIAATRSEIARLQTARANIASAFDAIRAAALADGGALAGQLPPFPEFVSTPGHPGLPSNLSAGRCPDGIRDQRARLSSLHAAKGQEEELITNLRKTYENFLAAISSE